MNWFQVCYRCGETTRTKPERGFFEIHDYPLLEGAAICGDCLRLDTRIGDNATLAAPGIEFCKHFKIGAN
jgi:hypothetical protein